MGVSYTYFVVIADTPNMYFLEIGIGYRAKISYLHFYVNAFKYVCSEKCVILSEI